MNRDGRDDAGAIAIVVAALAAVLFGFGAIVVDLGLARDLKQEARDSADAAALAGAGDLISCQGTTNACTRQAACRVKLSVQANFQGTDDRGLCTNPRSFERAFWRGCQASPPPPDELGAWRQRGSPCILFGTTAGRSRPTLVFVALPSRNSPGAFGGVVGSSGVAVTSSAVAGQLDNTVAGCALCVLRSLAPEGGAVQVVGGGSLYVEQVAPVPGSHGSVSVFPTAAGSYLTDDLPPEAGLVTFSPAPVVTGQDVVDPFSVPTPPTASGASNGDSTCAGDALQPGLYGRLDVAADAVCQLGAGTYEFRDDVRVRGQLLADAGTTISLTGTATLTVDVDATVDVSGPAPGAPVLYVSQGSVAVDGVLRLGGQVGALTLSAGGDVSVSGTLVVVGDVYLPNGRLDVTAGAVGVTGNVVAADVRTDDSTSLTVDSPGTATVQQARPDVVLVR